MSEANTASIKRKQTLLMIALCLTSIGVMSDMIFIPVADGIFSSYSSTPISVLNFILSGTALVMAVAALIFGPLANRFGRKVPLIGAFLIVTVSGLGMFLFNNGTATAILRGICGFGMGGLSVVGIDVIADNFEDENRRGAMVGLFTGSQGITGALLSALAGVIGTNNWRNVIHIFWACIPILILLFMFIPEDRKKTVSEMEDDAATAAMPWNKVIFLALAYFAFSMLYSVVYYEISIIIAEKQIGTAAVAGIMASISTIGGTIGALSFGWVYPKLKRILPAVVFLAMAAVYMVLYYGSGLFAVGFACLVLGILFTSGMSYYLTYCTIIVPEERINLSVSVTTFFGSVGAALSTYAGTILQQMTGSDTLTGIIPVVSAILLAGGIISLILFLASKRKA